MTFTVKVRPSQWGLAELKQRSTFPPEGAVMICITTRGHLSVKGFRLISTNQCLQTAITQNATFLNHKYTVYSPRLHEIYKKTDTNTHPLVFIFTLAACRQITFLISIRLLWSDLHGSPHTLSPLDAVYHHELRFITGDSLRARHCILREKGKHCLLFTDKSVYLTNYIYISNW